MNGLYEFEEMLEAIVLFIQGSMVFISLMGILISLIPYFVKGYAIMCTGRKVGIKNDFMPFVPVARQIYQMRIADCPVWYIFFFEYTTITIGSVGAILLLLFLLTKQPMIIFVLLVVYLIANRVFTFLYYRNFYSAFGFNPNTAWLNIIPSFGVISAVFTYLIAFSNAILYKDYVDPVERTTPPNANTGTSGSAARTNAGVITGIAGKYANANFDIVDGAELVFGRSPQDCNIVFDQTASDVSRKHCSIRFDGKANQYIVTDLFSSTGTFLENGSELEKGQPKTLARGTVIYLGRSKQNGFRLN